VAIISGRYDTYHHSRPSVWTAGRARDPMQYTDTENEEMYRRRDGPTSDMDPHFESKKARTHGKRILPALGETTSLARQIWQSERCYYWERKWLLQDEVVLDKSQRDRTGGGYDLEAESNSVSMINCMWATHEAVCAFVDRLHLENYPWMWAPMSESSSLCRNQGDGRRSRL